MAQREGMLSATYRRTDWRAERTRVLQKGWLPAWCRSSMDLLQDLLISMGPSSPISRPSKFNLGATDKANTQIHRQADSRTERQTGRQTGRQTDRRMDRPTKAVKSTHKGKRRIWWVRLATQRLRGEAYDRKL